MANEIRWNWYSVNFSDQGPISLKGKQTRCNSSDGNAWPTWHRHSCTPRSDQARDLNHGLGVTTKAKQVFNSNEDGTSISHAKDAKEGTSWKSCLLLKRSAFEQEAAIFALGKHTRTENRWKEESNCSLATSCSELCLETEVSISLDREAKDTESFVLVCGIVIGVFGRGVGWESHQQQLTERSTAQLKMHKSHFKYQS